MEQHFQSWFAEEVHKQLKSGVAIQHIKIDTRTSTLKPMGVNWLMGSLRSLAQKTEMVLNGFRKPGTLDAATINGQ